MKNIKLTIEFDGTDFNGWQTQPGGRTVQDVLTAALSQLTGEAVKVTGSSRTDAGVHAFGMSVNFHTESAIPPERFAYALNTILPDDVTVVGSEEVGPDFHSRFHATGKKYRYLILNSLYPSSLLRHRAYHIQRHLSLDAMVEAAKHIKGTHDFKAFCASGGSSKTTIRTITDIRLTKNEDLITLEVVGDGFLYNMVRIIAGTLIDAGSGRIAPESVADILLMGDRRKAGRTAPAHGLYLVEVYYEK